LWICLLIGTAVRTTAGRIDALEPGDGAEIAAA